MLYLCGVCFMCMHVVSVYGVCAWCVWYVCMLCVCGVCMHVVCVICGMFVCIWVVCVCAFVGAYFAESSMPTSSDFMSSYVITVM